MFKITIIDHRLFYVVYQSFIGWAVFYKSGVCPTNFSVDLPYEIFSKFVMF
jgi:hypothetical protein